MTLDATLRQTLERMEHHRYTAVPILDRDGGYAGTLTEGDLLWFMKNNPNVSFDQTNKIKLSDVQMRLTNRAVRIDANMVDLVSLAKVQNFVPVVDDMNRFIGIVRRSDIIDYCEKMIVSGRTPGEKEVAAG